MDQDIRKNLAEVSKNVEGVGRMIGSKRKDLDLPTLASALRIAADTLDTYADIQEIRK